MTMMMRMRTRKMMDDDEDEDWKEFSHARRPEGLADFNQLHLNKVLG